MTSQCFFDVVYLVREIATINPPLTHFTVVEALMKRAKYWRCTYYILHTMGVGGGEKVGGGGGEKDWHCG